MGFERNNCNLGKVKSLTPQPISFTFNLGSGALQRSTLRRKVNREEHADVPAELMKWVWAGGRKLKGLVKRRAAEINIYIY